MRCLSSVEFAVIVNWKGGSYFTPTKGLRQWDHLSPHLFIIVSDVLSSMINQAITHSFILGMKFGRGGPALSHLFFVDDSLMFLKATENNCRVIVRILDSYCTASGQLVNFKKSNMFFNPNTLLEVNDRLRAILNVTISEDPGKEVLIKSVAQAVSSYPMSVFLLPNGFCPEIDNILANFWWA
ncbi:unnamed protein product [Prunus brigantina]